MTELSNGGADKVERPGLGEIADVFTRYGNFTLGGGSATTAVMQRRLSPAAIGSRIISLVFALRSVA